MKNAQALLRWLLNRPDPSQLPSHLNLLTIKKDLSGAMWEPASSRGLNDEEIEGTYRGLCFIAKLLRTGEPKLISGYEVQVPVAGGTTIRPAVTRTSVNRYEIILLCAILTAKDSLRRCKKCRADLPVLFVRRKRQEYCSKKCSGLAGIRRFRRKTKPPYGFPLVLNPNP